MGKRTPWGLWMLAVCALVCKGAKGCIYKFGEAPGHELSKPAGVHFDYSFAGSNWDGTCSTGLKQSPINIPVKSASFKRVTYASRTIMDFGSAASNGSNIKVLNNGHVIQVEWSDPNYSSAASVAVGDLKTGVLTDTLSAQDKSQRAKITPYQFHFHTHSEHALGGGLFPVEAHIVSRAQQSELGGCSNSPGCLTVVGITFLLSEDDSDNAFLKDLFDIMPFKEGGVSYLPKGKTLDLTSILPSNRSYITYDGSLTTPPCSENVLWHVMLEPQYMSSRQLQQYLNATGDTECDDNPEDVKLLGGDGNSTDQLCYKLGAGQNYRLTQPLRERTISAYIYTGPKANTRSWGVRAQIDSLLVTVCAFLSLHFFLH